MRFERNRAARALAVLAIAIVASISVCPDRCLAALVPASEAPCHEGLDHAQAAPVAAMSCCMAGEPVMRQALPTLEYAHLGISFAAPIVADLFSARTPAVEIELPERSESPPEIYLRLRALRL